MNYFEFVTTKFELKSIYTVDLASEKINQFSRYPDKWHGGEGESFSQEIIDKSLLVVNRIKKLGFDVVDAFPSIDGTIGIYSCYSENHIDIEVKDSGLFRLIIENNKFEEFFNQEFELTQLYLKLLELKFEWDTSELFQDNIGTIIKVGLIAEHSDHLNPSRYLSSTSIVHPKAQMGYAII